MGNVFIEKRGGLRWRNSMGGQLEEGISGLTDEFRKLNNILRIVGILIIGMALVDIVDNLLSW